MKQNICKTSGFKLKTSLLDKQSKVHLIDMKMENVQWQ